MDRILRCLLKRRNPMKILGSFILALIFAFSSFGCLTSGPSYHSYNQPTQYRYQGGNTGRPGMYYKHSYHGKPGYYHTHIKKNNYYYSTNTGRPGGGNYSQRKPKNQRNQNEGRRNQNQNSNREGRR